MENKIFNITKFQKVINKDVSTLLLILISSDFLVSPLFFICPIILCLLLLINRLKKTMNYEKIKTTHALEICVILTTYIFLLPFLMLMLSSVCEEELLCSFTDFNGLSNKNVITPNFKKTDTWFNKLYSFLLNDYFASKFFLKW